MSMNNMRETSGFGSPDAPHKPGGMSGADDPSLRRKRMCWSDPHKTALNTTLKAGWLRRSCRSLMRESTSLT